MNKKQFKEININHLGAEKITLVVDDIKQDITVRDLKRFLLMIRYLEE